MLQTSTVLMFHGDNCGRAKEAAEQYAAILPDTKVASCERLEGGSDDRPLHRLELLAGESRFTLFDSDVAHDFDPTASVSVSLELDDEETVRRASEAFAEGGAVLVPLGSYPFSELFTWVQDRYGFSWQLSTGDGAS
jgi:predicted 3-demethylubiquinone-9 3-methyltransferase (glyoxalase superfamily)